MKKAFLTLFILTGIAAMILLTLDRLKGSPNSINNGFKRIFNTGKLQKTGEFLLDKTFYSISGYHENNIYLSTAKAGEILTLNTTTRQMQVTQLKIPVMKNLEPSFFTTVRYPYVFITGANTKKTIKANLLNDSIIIYDLKTGPILNAAIVNNEIGIFRCIDTLTGQATFKKINFVTNERKEEIYLSKPLKDFGFTYSGRLNYDIKTNTLAYSSFYSNHLVFFGPEAMASVIKGNTIDTTFIPRINAINKTSSFTHAAPPTVVNNISQVNNGTLYINSMLRADNEENISFRDNTAIDQYDIKNSKYTGTFYIPLPKGEVKDFYILSSGYIATLINDRLIIYKGL